MRLRKRRRAALIAVLFPLFFLVVIAIGVAAMYYRQMSFFKPAEVGALSPPSVC
jgi:type II secretory pathway component PulK